MAYIEIDVDLSDFDNDDFLEELGRRIKYRRLSQKEMSELLSALTGKDEIQTDIISVVDDMKIEHFKSVMENYKLDELIKILPMR